LKSTENSNQAAVDLKKPGVAKLVAKKVLQDIDDYCVKTYDDGHRNHLGASLIGHKCKRYLWYVFRWCFREKADGRKQRLFNRGHREEARFIEWLEGIGCQVFYENRQRFWCLQQLDGTVEYGIGTPEENNLDPRVFLDQTDPDYLAHVAAAKAQGVKFPQYRVSGANGHFGGSLDAIIILPPEYNIPEAVLGEFKTNGTGKGFDALVNSGMAAAKEQHYSQTCTYGADENYNFNFVLYMNINKNDDSMHVELVELDHNHGKSMIEKAERIIASDEAPIRLSDNPTYFECTYCAAKEICHKNAVPEKNCRSCQFAKPVENAEWFCQNFNSVIPKDFLKTGCDNYYPVTLPKQ
jgi:hypothetical protein